MQRLLEVTNSERLQVNQELNQFGIPEVLEKRDSWFSELWYVIWTFGWSMKTASWITTSGPFGKNCGLIIFNILHREDIQGSREAS